MRWLIVCALVTMVEAKPKGYIVNQANNIGYRIVYQAQPWDKARELCATDGAKLAVPKSQEEFEFIQKLVRAMHYPAISSDYKLLAWLGVTNQHHYRVWTNVDGENIEDTGFHMWAGHNGEGYSDATAEPHCAGIDAVNPGLRDYWCHRHQPYICQKDT